MEVMDSMEPVSFDVLLTITLENTEMYLSNCRNVLQQYLNIMEIFWYEATE